MKLAFRTIKKIAALTLTGLVSLNASAFDQIYIFGDSLSDTGNAKILSGNADNPYFPERFSNGPVAVDFITAAFGQTATPSLFLLGAEAGNNYAVGGAKAVDADGDESTFDTNLPTQVNSFLAYNGYSAPSDALYLIIMGGNDLFAAQAIRSGIVNAETGAERAAIRKASRESVKNAVLTLEAQINKLIAAGAQNILIGNAPDIGAVPATDDLIEALLANAQTKAQIRRANRMEKASTKLAALFNRKLSRAIGRMERQSDLDILEWDMFTFLSNQVEGGEDLGFTNTEDACNTLPLCEGFVFADGVHPTTVVHQRAGAEVLSIIQGQ
jgi:phospholipase/lecithinase/hemolysin